MKAKRVASITALAALTTALINASDCKAAIFTIGGQDYDVTTFTGSYNSNVSKFATPANGGVMPWFGNVALAQNFASAVGYALGTSSVTGGGPFFADRFDSASSDLRVSFINSSGNLTLTSLNGASQLGSNFFFAQATIIPPATSASVPGPLPLLGVASAFGMSRRLRRRIAPQPSKR